MDLSLSSSNWPLFAAASLLLLLARSLYHLASSRLRLRHVPGPSASSLIWGEEWNLYRNAPGSSYIPWTKTYGNVVKINGAFRHPILCITDSRAISYILSLHPYGFPKPHGVRVWFQKTIGEGILYTEGKAAHERQRRLLAPAFSQHSVRDLVPIFHETSGKLAAQWSQIIDNAGVEEAEIEVTNWAGRFALETVARTAFSHQFNLLSGESSNLLEALDGLTNNEHNTTSFYMRALFWIVPSILDIGKKGEMVRRTKSELGEVARKMWRDAKVADDSHDKSLMAQMLRADTSSDKRMEEDEVVAQLRTILSAAYEPVSASIAWILYELAVNPEIQEQLRAEISASPSEPTLEELTNDFPILNAVISETLRLHPPILENHHQAEEDTLVPLSHPLPGSSDMHLLIPKGTILFIPVNVIQTNPDVWGLDAHLFRPKRWMDGQAKHNLFAFSDGPRSCIGKRFAQAELKALIVTLIRQFSVSCRHDIEAFQSFVVRPRVVGTPMSSLPLVVRRV
uniref:Cytochrome P450 n=1 Tax=Mycena chlorophos TaxID=658473 RepID=A0ABQ0KXK8_MYCCL|nr:cytochrome P450 [Mycena chlorophos]